MVHACRPHLLARVHKVPHARRIRRRAEMGPAGHGAQVGREREVDARVSLADDHEKSTKCCEVVASARAGPVALGAGAGKEEMCRTTREGGKWEDCGWRTTRIANLMSSPTFPPPHSSLAMIRLLLLLGGSAAAATSTTSHTSTSSGPRTYLYFPSSDVMSTEETIFPQAPANLTNNVPALSALCDATPTCIGFNSNGWLKNGSTSLAPYPVDVYLLAPSPAPPEPLLQVVWPAPKSITYPPTPGAQPLRVSGALTFTATTPSADLDAAFARALARTFPRGTSKYAAGATLTSVTVTVANVSVPLQLGVDESYTLTLPADGSPGTIVSATVFGAYHALETLSQLVTFDFDAKAYVVAAGGPLVVDDAPRFTWRGVMVDPARHFIPLPTLEAVVDSLTYAKLNVLHVHTVDCDSWPLEVPGPYSNLWAAAFSPRERYTLDDLSSLVEYGRARGVRVVFEFDTPGHAGSMCDAYPSLCPSPTCREPLNPASADTLPAISSVLDALSGVQIDDVLHLGGDEVDPTCWADSPQVQDWMRAQGLNSTDGIYEYFVQKTNDMALALGRSPLRWEEVFKHFGTSLDKRTIIHAWLSSATMVEAANAGYRTVFSVSSSDYYLDYLDVRWDQTYGVDILANLTFDPPSAVDMVLGGELPLWEETVDAMNFLSVLWPRAAAGAERLWSDNFKSGETAQSYDVVNRIAQFRCLLLERGIPASSPGTLEAGGMGPAWSVGSCGGGYKALC
jgi:hexosaminidase